MNFEGCPSGKTGYPNYFWANLFAEKFNKRNKHRQRAYHCSECDGWHTGRGLDFQPQLSRPEQDESPSKVYEFMNAKSSFWDNSQQYLELMHSVKTEVHDDYINYHIWGFEIYCDLHLGVCWCVLGYNNLPDDNRYLDSELDAAGPFPDIIEALNYALEFFYDGCEAILADFDQSYKKSQFTIKDNYDLYGEV